MHFHIPISIFCCITVALAAPIDEKQQTKEEVVLQLLEPSESPSSVYIYYKDENLLSNDNVTDGFRSIIQQSRFVYLFDDGDTDEISEAINEEEDDDEIKEEDIQELVTAIVGFIKALGGNVVENKNKTTAAPLSDDDGNDDDRKKSTTVAPDEDGGKRKSTTLAPDNKKSTTVAPVIEAADEEKKSSTTVATPVTEETVVPAGRSINDEAELRTVGKSGIKELTEMFKSFTDLL